MKDELIYKMRKAAHREKIRKAIIQAFKDKISANLYHSQEPDKRIVYLLMLVMLVFILYAAWKILM